MDSIKELAWYLTLDWSMIWVCVGAVIVHMLYLELFKNPPVKITMKIGLFYLLSSLTVLSFVPEIGTTTLTYLIDKFTGLQFEFQGEALHILAFLSGLLGGYLVVLLIKKVNR